jgi:predicted anti-sigma-YlaC factor YlaD
MSSSTSGSTGGRGGALGVYASERVDQGQAIRAGLLGGLVGAVTIWVYEAVVWVGAQHLMPLSGIPGNATGLVFGKAVQSSLGFGSYVLGTAIHLVFALAWGVLFALIWPAFRRRGVEATLVALFYAVIAWIVMHVAIAIVSSNHPNYLDPNVIVGGFMSHLFFTVPLALIVKHRLADARMG